LDQQLVVFVDILGFREAVESWNEGEMTKLIDLLRNVAGLQSNAAFDQSPEETKATAAVTTFSDHIVVSYPVANLSRLGETIPLQIGMHNVKRFVATFAREVVNLGLLIRGGVTVGPLHHADKVVVGAAMNEAYKLESQVAIYPRVAVSRKVYGRIGQLPSAKLFRTDHDGVTHLNYFEYMIESAGNPAKHGANLRRKAWLDSIERKVAENIARFEEEEDWKKLANWAWFKKQIERARAGLSKEMYRDPEI
jgi:class 3 adenylate cyclase